MRLLAWAIVALWCLLSLSAGVLPLAPDAIDLSRILQPPSGSGWFGYDELGRPLADRLILGARTSLAVACLVVAINFFIGVPVGMLSAFLGGWWDRCTVLLIDVFMAFPGILLAIAVAGLLGPGLENAVIALAAAGWVGFARLARAQTLAIVEYGHVEAARTLGTGTAAILTRHVLPLLVGTLGVQVSYEIAAVTIAESTLSFLGLGVQPPQPSLGGMVLEGTRYMLVAPHLAIAPGAILVALVLAVNLLGDDLRDRLDPHRHAGLR